MTNLLKKAFGVFSSVALAASMLISSTASVHATSAGEVYKTTDGTVWFITSDMQKRPFTSAGAFLSYGFLSFSQVKDADASVTALPTGAFIAPQDGRIFCATATKGSDVSGECSLITGGMKSAFTSAAVFSGQGFSFSRAFYGDSSFLTKTSNTDSATAQHRNGTLINNGGTVQLVVNGGLWGVPSMDVFNSWGWSFADVVPANAADKSLTQIGIIPGRVAGQLVPTGTTGTPTPTGTNNGSFNPNGGTQGSINTITMGSRQDTEALESQNDVEIYAADIETNNDGALMLKSADVWFANADSASASDKPWDYFTDVSLMVDGHVVATKNADSASDWSDVTDGSIGTVATAHEYKMRFTNLNAVLPNNDTTSVSVAVSVVNTIDSADQDAVWYTELGNIRVLDESGFTTDANTSFDTTTTLEDSFTVGGADAAALTVRDANDDIAASVIKVDDTNDTNGVPVYSFEVEETNDVDVNISEMTLTFVTPGAENTVIKKAYLYKGTTKVGEEVMASNGVVTFDNMNIDINAGDTETFTVKVDLYDNNGGVRYAEGATLAVSVTSIDTFVDANGNDEGDITPTVNAVSNTHELRSVGIMTDFNTSSATRTLVADAAGEFDQGEFKISFDVTSFGGDMRIDRSCEEGGADAAGQGVEYTITNSGSNSTTCNLSSSSTDTEDTANTYEVDEGTTRTFTLTVTATSSADAYAEVSLESVNWGTATNDTNANYYNFNLGDYKTDSIFLNTF